MATQLIDEMQILRYELFLADFNGYGALAANTYLADARDRWIQPDGWDKLLALEVDYLALGRTQNRRKRLEDLVANQDSAPLALRAYSLERYASSLVGASDVQCVVASFHALEAAQRLSNAARQLVVANTLMNLWEGGLATPMDDKEVEDSLDVMIGSGAYRAPSSVLWWVGLLLNARPPDPHRHAHATSFLSSIVRRSHHSLAHAFHVGNLNRCKNLLAELEQK